MFYFYFITTTYTPNNKCADVKTFLSAQISNVCFTSQHWLSLRFKLCSPLIVVQHYQTPVFYGLRVNPSEIPVSSLGSVNLSQSVIFSLLRLFIPVNIQYIIKGKFRSLEYQARIVKLKKTVSHF